MEKEDIKDLLSQILNFSNLITPNQTLIERINSTEVCVHGWNGDYRVSEFFEVPFNFQQMSEDKCRKYIEGIIEMLYTILLSINFYSSKHDDATLVMGVFPLQEKEEKEVEKTIGEKNYN